MGDLIALLLVTLNGLLGPGVTEAQLESELARVIKAEQPAPLEKVTVDAVGLSGSGLKRIEFHFEELYMDPVLIDSATFSVTDVRRTSAGKLRLGGIVWHGRISEQALTAGLQADGGNMKQSRVAVDPAGLTLRGKWPGPFGAKISYGVTGNLSVEEQTYLMFSIQRSDVSGIGVPSGLNNLIEREVNPVYDLAAFAARSRKEIELARRELDYDFTLLVEEIEPKDGHIIVSGSA